MSREAEAMVEAVLWDSRQKDARIATLKAELEQLTNMTADEYRAILVRAEQGEHLADRVRVYLRSLGKSAPIPLANALLVYDRYVEEAED